MYINNGKAMVMSKKAGASN